MISALTKPSQMLIIWCNTAPIFLGGVAAAGVRADEKDVQWDKIWLQAFAAQFQSIDRGSNLLF